MKKVRGAVRALKAQVMLRGLGTGSQNVFLVLACSNMFLCTFEVSFTWGFKIEHYDHQQHKFYLYSFSQPIISLFLLTSS